MSQSGSNGFPFNNLGSANSLNDLYQQMMLAQSGQTATLQSPSPSTPNSNSNSINYQQAQQLMLQHRQQQQQLYNNYAHLNSFKAIAQNPQLLQLLQLKMAAGNNGINNNNSNNGSNNNNSNNTPNKAQQVQPGFTPPIPIHNVSFNMNSNANANASNNAYNTTAAMQQLAQQANSKSNSVATPSAVPQNNFSSPSKPRANTQRHSNGTPQSQTGTHANKIHAQHHAHVQGQQQQHQQQQQQHASNANINNNNKRKREPSDWLELVKDKKNFPVHDEKRNRTMLAEAVDTQKALYPDYKTPFSSVDDMFQRLLVYHVFIESPTANGYTNNLSHIKQADWDEKLSKIVSGYHKQKEKLESRLDAVIATDFATEEENFITSLILKDEQASLEREKASIQELKAASLALQKQSVKKYVYNQTNNSADNIYRQQQQQQDQNTHGMYIKSENVNMSTLNNMNGQHIASSGTSSGNMGFYHAQMTSPNSTGPNNLPLSRNNPTHGYISGNNKQQTFPDYANNGNNLFNAGNNNNTQPSSQDSFYGTAINNNSSQNSFEIADHNVSFSPDDLFLDELNWT